MSRKGKQIRIPTIEIANGTGEFERINPVPFRGRPTKIFKRLLDFGIENGFIDEKLVFEDLIYFGFDRGYINDAFLISATMKYYLMDMNWTKKHRLKELEQNEDETEEEVAGL